MPDGDRLGPLLAGVALNGVGAVTGRVDAHVGADEAVVANGHEGLVEDGEMEIGKKALAHLDVLAVVAIERLVDEGSAVGHLAQNPVEHLPSCLQLGRTNVIVFLNQVLHLVEFPDQFLVHGRVQLA